MAASNMSSDEILKNTAEVPANSGGLQNAVKSEEADKLEIDLSVKCRGCFVEDPEMHYLFTVFDQQLSLADILMQTSPFVCKEDDGFPPYLCTRCTTSLIDFFNFKIQFQKTDLYVRTLLGKNIPASIDFVAVKSEVPEESDESSNMDDSVPEDHIASLQDIDENLLIPDITNISGISSQHCVHCKEDFMNVGEYETHMAKEHGQNPFLKYHLFKKMVGQNVRALAMAKKRKKFMEAEMREQILMNMPGKLCRMCKKKFPDEEFKSHWDSHKVHICEVCGQKCIKKSDLVIHKQSVHSDVRNFSCMLCDRSFKTKQLLKRHQVVHLNPRAYCCDLCGQRFNDSGTLKTHIQLKHIGNRDFICPICGLAFPMKATLEKHIVRHNKNRPPSFSCDICASAFKDKSSLKRHHLVKHSNDFVRPACEDCGKTYCSNTKLRYHIERHHSGNKVERKKRGPKKVQVERNSSTDISDSEESSDSFEEPSRRGPKVRNVSKDFYRRSTSYSPRRPGHPDKRHSEYFIKSEYESEEESETSSESE